MIALPYPTSILIGLCHLLLLFACPLSTQADTELKDIQILMDAATSGSKKNVTYIVVGDSTRDAYAVPHKYWYKKTLEAFNIHYVHNAQSGIRAANWVTGKGRAGPTLASLQKAVSAATGDGGEDTIIEVSIGSNDMSAFNDKARVKVSVKKCLTELQRQLPKAHIFLFNPLRSARVSQDHGAEDLKAIYRELSTELGLPFINKNSTLKEKFEDPAQRVKFFYDNAHPNYFGAIRLIDYVMNRITGPISRAAYHRNPHHYADTSAAPKNLATDVEILHGIWNTTSGKFADNFKTHRALQEIEVIGNTLLKIDLGGNKHTVCVKNSKGEVLERFDTIKYRDPKNLNTVLFRFLYLPREAASIAINISSKGESWDALNHPLNIGYITDGIAEMDNEEIYDNDKR